MNGHLEELRARLREELEGYGEMVTAIVAARRYLDRTVGDLLAIETDAEARETLTKLHARLGTLALEELLLDEEGER